MELSSAEISNKIVEVEKELAEHLKQQEIVDLEKTAVEREMIVLELKKKDLTMALKKATYNTRQLELSRRQLEKQFWQVKNSGQ